MRNLKLFINTSFNNVIKLSCLVNNYKNDLDFHNYHRLKYKIPKGYRTYDGKLNCGVTTFVLGNILKKKQVPIKLFMNQSGYGKYKEDHVFLKYNDLIIDPTYKQFFTNNQEKCLSEYHNYLYQCLPPFFVGTRKDLVDLYLILYDKSNLQLKYQEFDESVLNNWLEDYDVSERLDFEKIHNKENFLKELSVKHKTFA